MADEFQKTLRDSFQIHKACEKLPIQHIKLAVKPGEKRIPVNKMLRKLSLAGYARIVNILDAPCNEFVNIVDFGPSEYDLLLDLLQRISRDPGLIVHLEVFKVLEEENKSKEERDRRIDMIKHRLRDMGMIE
ncbi:hypothetical protein JI735_34425 (plasmid) [Paenibacillus sonchi]|uniref:Uncharacterized protein n=1 Tax=Paenibacillus sonchi TaxID=373687 RepID=A0A974PJC5_9BACL|nr:hypothetical protein [Paenibacillus sonchi]QQZ64533.1 hypothetical protein JI735_34425 [Paenibacillus sonchi]